MLSRIPLAIAVRYYLLPNQPESTIASTCRILPDDRTLLSQYVVDKPHEVTRVSILVRSRRI